MSAFYFWDSREIGTNCLFFLLEVMLILGLLLTTSHDLLRLNFKVFNKLISNVPSSLAFSVWVFQRFNCCEQNPPRLDLWRQESSFYSVRVQQVNPNPVDVLTPLTWWGVSRSLQTVCGGTLGLSLESGSCSA